MTTTQEIKKEPTRSLENIKSLFQSDADTSDEKLKKYESLIDKIAKIPIEDIELDENIRASIDTNDESFKSLMRSIRRHGIQQNIVVELRKLAVGFKIVCVSGHRRVTAAKMIGTINVVPAIIKLFEKSDTRIELALAENLLREGLHCLDVANGYQQLFNFGWTKEKLMETYGKTHRTISTYLKMASWPEEAKELIRTNDLFTTRLLVHQIACKKFSTNDELMTTLNKFIDKPIDKISKKQTTRLRLTEYLSEKNYPEKTSKAIEQAFKDLNFLD